ncbi:kinase-like domain-containing protein [Obelidium mucronatum]|nr:kinase-like domain-containing protein [Obelidium mucronatum]
MGSIRKPKRLIMIGSDGKEYPWLAKGGEDLRLDQRIEQMFTIMNTMIEKNQYCIRNRVSLATYQVVPMSTSLGLIEWVDNTKPLKSCMESSPSFKKNFPDSQAVFMEFVNKHGKNGYETFLQTASSKHVTENIQSLWIRNRESYLRHFFIRLTVSPEAFFQVRTEFANSLAALNICQYLLGIGDRHLDNFLVDLKTGRIIGIDFGHAFGSATELLPVPELVPFRLTNQIEKFLLPLGVQSLIVHPMTNVLSAVQDDKERLLNALNIFVNEPLIEWRKFAEKQIKRNQAKSGGSSMGGSSSGESTGVVPPWYPQQKLEVAKRKLEGENPCVYYG